MFRREEYDFFRILSKIEQHEKAFSNEKMKRLGFLRSFLACKRSPFGQERFLCLQLQHNAVYVAAADFGGYFYIINRIFSIR